MVAVTACAAAGPAGAAPQLPTPRRGGKAKKSLPAVDGGMTYQRWRSKYVREDCGGLYVSYNGKHNQEPSNAATVSEVRGFQIFAAGVHLLLRHVLLV